MAMKPPYCEVHGLVCTDVIQSVQVDGAELKTSPQTLAGRRYGDILEQGRNSRKITLSARFLTEDDLDTWIGHINSAPEDFEAYPFRSDRCCYVKKAYATVTDPEVANINGDWTTFHRAKAYLYTREPWMYGANKGARYDSPLSLPVTVSDIKHEGTVDDLAGIDKLSAVGYYNPMPTAATLISVAGDGTVFVVYNDGSIRSFGKDKPSVSLSSPNYPPVSIFAKSSSLLYAVCSDGDLRYWEDGTWYLWPATTNAKKVAVGLDGTVAIIGSDDALYVWSGGSWISKDGVCLEIICVSASEIYVIGTDDHFWRYNGSAWVDLGGTTVISKIALAQDATHGIYALRYPDGLILKWTGDAEGWADWWQDPLSVPDLVCADALTVRNNNEMWSISDGTIFMWDGNWEWLFGYVHGGGGSYDKGMWIRFDQFYCTNFSVSCGPQSILLCRKLMANDLFEVDRFGNVQHSYENDFDCTLEKLQHDLHGGNYVNTGCTLADGKLTIAGYGRFILPFRGPIPISGEKPYIDLYITAMGQYPPKLVTYSTMKPYNDGIDEFFGVTELDTSLLHVGKNRIYIPGFEGKEDLFVGFIERRCWVSADNLNGPIWDAAGDGNAAGAIIIGGQYMLTPYGAETHLFNGSNWLEGNANLNTGRHAAAGGGSSSDAIVMGGMVSGNNNSQSTEEFNGTAWAAGGNLLIGRHWHGGGGGSASAFVAGGDAASVMTSGQTEEYNGTSWVSNGNLSRLRQSLDGGGSGTSAMVCGGHDEGVLCSNHDVSAGAAWALVGGLLTARNHHVADGDYDMGFACAGSAGSPELGSTEEHDGYAWSQGGQMLTPREMATGGASWLNTVLQSGIVAGGVHNVGRYVYHDYCTELYGRYSSITIDWLKAVVKRCINPEILPKVSPGDVFDLQVACAGGNALTSLEIYFRDAWWF